MPNDTFTANPLTLVFDALWSCLEESPNFISDVAAGNRIKFNLTANRNPQKQQINDSDLPEVVLTSTGGSGGLFVTSSSSRMVQRYSWVMSTGDFRIQNYLHQVKWEIFCGMTGWQSILGALVWPLNSGKTFVKRTDLLDITEGLSNPDQNRGINGWSAIWNAEVEMAFTTQDLIDARGY